MSEKRQPIATSRRIGWLEVVSVDGLDLLAGKVGAAHSVLGLDVSRYGFDGGTLALDGRYGKAPKCG